MTAPTPPKSALPKLTLPSAVLAAAFDQEARRLHHEFKLPGASFVLLLPDGDYFVNLGVTSLEHPQPITAETIFQIGSTTKTLTSLTCSTLVAEGKLDLDAPVRTYLPDFKLQDEHAAAHVTVRDLLTHQGGFLGDLFEETGDGDDALSRGLDNLAGSPQMVPLRGHWSYNNAGFFVAGRVIEVLTNQTYEQAVTERVLTPLGMGHTFFFTNQIMTYPFAVGYNKVGEKFEPQRPWMLMRSAAPAGSTCSSTAVDMVKYARYLMDGAMHPLPTAEKTEPAPEASTDRAGENSSSEPDAPAEPVLKQVDRESLWATRLPIGSAINGFPGERGMIGQSWFVDQYDAATIISHGGTTLGHQSDFWVSPDRGVGFIALTNGSNGHAMNRRLSEWIKHTVLDLSAPALGEHAPTADELAEVAGQYDAVGQPYKLQATHQDGALKFTLPDGASGGTRDLNVRFIAPDRAVISGGDADGLGVEFLRDGGAVTFVRFGGRIYPREQAETGAESVEPAESAPETVTQG